MYLEPPDSPELKTAFNREETMKFIKKTEEENFQNAEWFYGTIARQESIEILKEKGLNKAFLVRETDQEFTEYELCMKHEDDIFIHPILCKENKYYFQ